MENNIVNISRDKLCGFIFNGVPATLINKETSKIQNIQIPFNAILKNEKQSAKSTYKPRKDRKKKIMREKCIVCKNDIIEEEELGGEICNFCYGTICEKCYDKVPSSEVMTYGWNCDECLIINANIK